MVSPTEELRLRRELQGGVEPQRELEIRRQLAQPAEPVQETAQPQGPGIVSSALTGFNQQVADILRGPSRSLQSIGIPERATDFIPGVSGLDVLGRATEAIGVGAPPQTAGERIAQRTGQEVAGATTALVPTMAAANIARTAATAAPSLLQRLGQQIMAPFQTAPAVTAATDVGLSLASGAGAGVAREVAPGSVSAELLGQFTPLLVPSLAAGALRVGLRGGAAGQEGLQQSIDDFATAGATPSLGQATEGARGTAFQGLESTLGRLPGGASVMLRASRDTARRIGDRIDNITTSLARNADPEQAGRVIQQGLVGQGDSFLGRFNDVSERLFNNIDRFIPRDTAVDVTNSREAFTALSTPVEGAENLSEVLLINPQIARAAQAFTADVGEAGQLTYGALKDVRSAIGRLLTSSSLVDDAPRASLKRIYGALSSDMEAAAAAAGPGAARAFERANGYYSAGLGRLENVIQPLIGNRVPERVFRALELSGRDGATTIRTIYRSLAPEERAVTTSLILRRIGHATPGRQGAEGAEFSTETFLTNWNRIAPDSKDVLFNQREFSGLRDDLDAIARTAESIREGSQVLANPSGTGAAQSQAAGLALAGAGAFQAAQGSPELLTTVLAGMASANVGARLMTSPRFVRWLARGTQLPPRQIPIHIGRLTTTLSNSDAATAQEVVELLRAISPQSEATGGTTGTQPPRRPATTAPQPLAQ